MSKCSKNEQALKVLIREDLQCGIAEQGDPDAYCPYEGMAL